MKEVQEFHPLVAQWLNENGYDYEHEYKMPDYGRVDFYATHPNRRSPLLIECKTDRRDFRKGIVQAATYRVQIPEADVLIALPSNVKSQKLDLMAEKYEVGILRIETSNEKVINFDRVKTSTKNPDVERTSNTYFTPLVGVAASNTHNLIHNYEHVYETIMTFHNHNTNSVSLFFDFIVAYYSCGQVSNEIYSDKAVYEAQQFFMLKIVSFAVLHIGDNLGEVAISRFITALATCEKGLFTIPRIVGNGMWSDAFNVNE